MTNLDSPIPIRTSYPVCNLVVAPDVGFYECERLALGQRRFLSAERNLGTILGVRVVLNGSDKRCLV